MIDLRSKRVPCKTSSRYLSMTLNLICFRLQLVGVPGPLLRVLLHPLANRKRHLVALEEPDAQAATPAPFLAPVERQPPAVRVAIEGVARILLDGEPLRLGLQRERQHPVDALAV